MQTCVLPHRNVHEDETPKQVMALICRLNEVNVAERGFKPGWEQTRWKTTNSCLCKTAGLLKQGLEIHTSSDTHKGERH